MKILTMLGGAAAMGLAFGALASEPMKPATFDSLDADTDGKISATEAAKHADLKTGFTTADANGDGYLSKAEFASWQSSQSTSRQAEAGTTPPQQ